VILPVLSAAFLYAASPDTVLAYAEAKARADRYEADPAANNWRATQMTPVLTAMVPPMLDACVPLNATRKPDFTVILSFKAGAFEAVRFTADDPMAACIVDRLSAAKWPAPPHPNFAEEIHLNLNPAK
jgi:hypothetical protein